jgi:hypothetical protein
MRELGCTQHDGGVPAVMIRQPAPYAAAVSLANEIGRICTWVADTAIPVLVTGAA